MSFKRAGLAVAAMATLGSFGFAAPAAAAPTGAVSEQLAPPPRCVTAIEDTGVFTDTLIVDNNCNFNVRVKVFVAFGPDSACTNVLAGESFEHSYASVGRFDGLQSC